MGKGTPVEFALPKKCGIRNGTEKTRIIGGTYAKNDEFPWQVLLKGSSGWQTKWSCGGSLISDQWILTAAHCLPDGAVFGMLVNQA
jgi:secreted trypsin-like serine protease